MSESEEYEVRESIQVWHLLETGWVLTGSDNPNMRRPTEVLKQVILRRIGSNILGVTDTVIRKSTKNDSAQVVAALERAHGTKPEKIDWSWRNK